MFVFSHVETDIVLFTVCYKVRFTSNIILLVLVAESTDAYVQAAYVAKQMQGPLYINLKDLSSASGLCDISMEECLIPLHAITGSDHNSSMCTMTKRIKPQQRH